jgi:hypothetical protein
MQRVVGVSALAFGACLLAGCGGTSLQAKADKVVGDPHAMIVSTETVRTLSGARLTVVVLKPSGSTGLGCIEAVGAGPVGQTVPSSLVPGCPPADDAYVLLNPTTHADGGDMGISRFQVAAIAKARRLSPRFRPFPAVNQLTVRCAVPNQGAPGGVLPGMCATIALPFGKPVRCVAFSEAFRLDAFTKLIKAGWVVKFSRDGHFQSIRRTARPPQPWSGHQPNTCSEM